MEFYGGNNRIITTLLKYSLDWCLYLYLLDKDIVELQIKEYQEGEFAYNYAKFHDTTWDGKSLKKEITEDEFIKALYVHTSQTLICARIDEDPDHNLLEDGDILSCGRNMHLINVGGMVTEIAWLNRDLEYTEPESYVAIAVAPKLDDPNRRFIDPDLALQKFNYDSSYKSFLRIFKLDAEKKTVVACQNWVFQGWGPVREIKVVPSKNSLVWGILFGDGVLRFFDFEPTADLKYYKVNTPANSLSLPQPHYISSFDFVDCETIAFGTNLGFLGEMALSAAEPAFFVQRHLNLVKKVVVQQAVPHYCPTLIHSISSGGSMKITHRTNPQISAHSSLNAVRKSLLVNDYLPPYYSFITQFLNVVKANLPRALSLSAFTMIRHIKVALPLCFAGSHLHPFALSGADNGELLMSNTAYPMAFPTKIGRSKVSQIRRFCIEFNREKQLYKLTTRYVLREQGLTAVPMKEKNLKKKNMEKLLVQENPDPKDIESFHKYKYPSKVENLESMVDDELYDGDCLIFPPEMSVSRVRWCENRAAFNWYAAGVSCDAVILEGVELAGDER